MIDILGGLLFALLGMAAYFVGYYVGKNEKKELKE